MSGNTQNERESQRVAKNFHSELDRDSLNRTRDKHTELNSLIEDLSNKLTTVSNSQEKEFLSAYRVHMLGVQLELKELKLKVAKAELSLQDDGEVSKLEDECNWFRTETNRLNAHCSSMQADIISMKNRLTTLRDQNKFLSQQLKAVMKRSRVIEVELEYNQQEREEMRKMMGSEGEEREGEGGYVEYEDYNDVILESPPQIISKSKGNNALGKSESAVQLGLGSKKGNKKVPKMNRTVSYGSGVKRTLLAPPDVLKQVPGRYKRPTSPEVKDDFMSFGMTKKEKKLMGNPEKLTEHIRQLNEIRNSRSNVEIYLEDCLKRKFEEVISRRSKLVMENSKNRYIKEIAKSNDGSHTLGSTGSSELVDILDSTSFNTTTPNEKRGHPVYGGISGLGLEYLTDSDRKDVMLDLLSIPIVFEEVVKLLQDMMAKNSRV